MLVRGGGEEREQKEGEVSRQGVSRKKRPYRYEVTEATGHVVGEGLEVGEVRGMAECGADEAEDNSGPELG